MGNYEKIENAIRKNDGFITREEIIDNGIPASSFSFYSKKMKLEKISPGVYGTPDFVPDEMAQLQRRYPKAIYYGISALYLLKLTDVIPDYLEVIAPSDYRIRKDSFRSELIVHHESKPELFDFGNAKAKTIFGNEVLCCGMEKTIVEMMRRRKYFDSDVFVRALRRYWESDEKNLPLLNEYAEKRNLSKEVRDTMEIIANDDQ